MKHLVPHDLTPELARKAADAALKSYGDRFPDYAPQVEWTDPKTAEVNFKAKGMSIKGLFEILPNAVAIDMEVPLLLRPFKAKAIDVIEREIQKWIAQAKSGALS